ncbi:MAG: putative inorganic carbon transporter subunit DabA, partial [Nitrosospira sp.]
MQEAHLRSGDQAGSPREHIIAALNHLDHVLPGQAPILNFVHHNTLHGFQHLPFEEALAAFEVLTGIRGYLPEIQSRAFYWQGRIDDSDILAALAHDPRLEADTIICTVKDKAIQRKELYRIALLFDLQPLSVSQLNWQIEELQALGTVQTDVPEQACSQLLADSADSDNVIRELWESILTKLEMEHAGLHPENLLDLSMEQAEEWLEHVYDGNVSSIHERMQQQASETLDDLLGQLGDSLTVRGFIMELSGIDILDSVRPQLIRICASAMDEGIAAWQIPERSRLGLYAAWRATAQYDANPFLHELPDWQQVVEQLPMDAVDTIILQLSQLEIPQAKWEGYLRRLALELPGWSGLINWRQHHPDYHTANDAKPNLADYLAIRLTLDRLWLNQVCQENWRIEAKLSSLQTYFRKNLSEFMVRRQLYKGDLPEYLTQRVESLTMLAVSERHERAAWQQLADLIQTWQFSPLAERRGKNHTIYNSGWRLFRLCQHLGLNASSIQELRRTDLLEMLMLLDQFSEVERCKVWLYAYERHYRDCIFRAIHANHNQGKWAKRDTRPESQIIFCFDDREESFRRHLEELNPAVETFGAPG